MRGFFYGVVGLFVTLILVELLSDSHYDSMNIIIPSIIMCGCTGAIVSAIKSEKENTIRKDDDIQ